MSLALLTLTGAQAQASIHVATTGSDSNDGSASAPLLTIHKAVEEVKPGDTIWIHGGTYRISERIKIPQKATSPDARCYMWAVPGEGEVIIDGSLMHHTTEATFKMGRCIYVNHLANYWHFKGLTLCNAEDNGMKVEGSYNIIEQCTFHDNNDTGLQIGMYKDFSIEETKELPAGIPQFNPDYRYCRGNVVINCDSYNNYDSRTYSTTDDGGDADGFACKLFPGPGTEFHGCRAWNNSDDNWDLYMVYHPVVIDHCWSFHAGYTPTGDAIGNGNGFKLGGGGSSGGAAFDQSVGAHLVRNCVAFDNLHKGFDQNNAYEGMYVLNCTAWGNEFNYRFPTYFKYGSMYLRNCIGFKPTRLNHEFLSENKEGAKLPNTDYNSWTTLDGCDPYKEGNKVNGVRVDTKDYSSEFISLSVDDFLAPRQADGSLPVNDFARLKPGSVMIDKGEPIVNFVPARMLSAAEAAAAGLTLDEADILTIAYNDAAPDFGAYETDGVPATEGIELLEKATIECASGNASQEIIESHAIDTIRFRMGGSGKAFMVEGLPDEVTATVDGNELVLVGQPMATFTYSVKVTGGPREVALLGTITVLPPSHIITGDWYHFQDALADMPATLRNIFALIDGSDTNHPSSIDPEKNESAVGCTTGAVIMGRSMGGFQITFPEGVLDFRLNLHFTGGRAFRIEWEQADGRRGTVVTEKYSKGTYCSYDVLGQLGVGTSGPASTVGQPLTIRVLNTNTGGEVRLYDLFARVPGEEETVYPPSSIAAVQSSGRPAMCLTSSAAIVQGAELRSLTLFTAAGRMVRSTVRSGVLQLTGVQPGQYVLQAMTTDGQLYSWKVVR